MPWTFYDGSGNKLNTVATSGVLQNVVEDLTPQLGANLDLNGFNLAFPATQTADAGANVLDDYEEGTFTPQIADATHDGSGEGQTYTTQTGKYTKIGDLVFIQLYLAVNSLGTLTGGDTAHIEGLPFTTSGRGSLTVGAAGSLALNNASETVAANLNNGVTYITLRNWDSTGGVSVLTITEFSAGGEIEIAGFYPV